MKKLILLCLLFFPISLSAQVPQKMSYQAVIRNSGNSLVTNHSIGIQISILMGTIDGSSVYTETHTSTTNANGLVTIEIGTGNIITGDFQSIDWSNGPYFIKTETDPTGGTNYTITGTSQLLSVPYALYAKSADTITGPIAETDPLFGSSPAVNITETDISNWNNKQIQLTTGIGIQLSGNRISLSEDFYLGQDTLGGIVFYIYSGSDGRQHGLIVSKTQTEASWQGSKDWVTANFSGTWYLPSIDELNILFNNRYHVNKTLVTLIGQPGVILLSNSGGYWSDSQISVDNAFFFSFHFGHVDEKIRDWVLFARAIRAF
jgi:hypothetical protein